MKKTELEYFFKSFKYWQQKSIQLENVIKEIELYCDIAFRDSELNPEEPITKKDLEYIYNIIANYKNEQE